MSTTSTLRGLAGVRPIIRARMDRPSLRDSVPAVMDAFAFRNAFDTNDFHSRGPLCYIGRHPAAQTDSWTLADNADTGCPETVYTAQRQL